VEEKNFRKGLHSSYCFPDDSTAIPDSTKLTLLVMDPALNGRETANAPENC